MVATPATTQETADPLPYIIVFAILFLIALGVLTWVLDVWNKQHQCAINPNIWCSDNWTCNTSCPTGSPYNACFVNVGPTGLASCLYGPNSEIATTCLNPPTGTGGTTATACSCVTSMQQTNNCFSGCASNLGSVTGGATCCCAPGAPGCQYCDPSDPTCQNPLPLPCRPT